MDVLAQRCAKFFAWGLQQSIKSHVEPPTTEVITIEVTATEVTTKVPEEDASTESEEEDNSDYEELNLDEEDSDSSEDEIVNFQPLDKKPSFKHEKSGMASRLDSFLAEMKTANEELNAEDGNMEVTDSDEEHIEMNLGLGILEEVSEENEVLIEQV